MVILLFIALESKALDKEFLKKLLLYCFKKKDLSYDEDIEKKVIINPPPESLFNRN